MLSLSGIFKPILKNPFYNLLARENLFCLSATLFLQGSIFRRLAMRSRLKSPSPPVSYTSSDYGNSEPTIILYSLYLPPPLAPGGFFLSADKSSLPYCAEEISFRPFLLAASGNLASQACILPSACWTSSAKAVTAPGASAVWVACSRRNS
jgi:hypothetical protein